MIQLDQLRSYAESKTNLTSITTTFALDKEDPTSLINTKITEEYMFETEDEVNKAIDEAKKSNDFCMAKKDYKKPKYNKEGYAVREGYWIVKISYKFSA